MSINSITSGSSNSSSLLLQSLNSNANSITDIQTQLSTGKKILDPAQQGVVTRLNSQVASFAAAHNNITKAQNVLSVASTGLTTVSGLLTQMQDLANKAGDATMTSADAAKLNQTFQNLLKQITSTANNSKVDGNGLMLFNAKDMNIQTGLGSSDTTTIAAVASTAADLVAAGSSPSSKTKADAIVAADVANLAKANATTALTAASGSTAIAAATTALNTATAAATTATAAAVAVSPSYAYDALKSAAHVTDASTANTAGQLDISTTAEAKAAITALQTALDKVSTYQSSIAADQQALTAVDTQDANISQNLQSTIDSIQKPDAADLQIQLQNFNNAQSMNYYLINQMNQEAQGVLTIFR